MPADQNEPSVNALINALQFMKQTKETLSEQGEDDPDNVCYVSDFSDQCLSEHPIENIKQAKSTRSEVKTLREELLDEGQVAIKNGDLLVGCQ